MKNTTVVALLLLSILPIAGYGSGLSDSISRLESDWAENYYLKDTPTQKTTYLELIERASVLCERFSDASEPKIWLAILLSSNAVYEGPFTALQSLDRAKQLLEEAIAKQPDALEGAAYVTLGTLYYKVPGWPISFGNNERAETLLKKALEINPNGIDANYFYADYLAEQEKTDEAEYYFKTAIRAPVREEQILADTELKKDVLDAYMAFQNGNKDQGMTKFLSLFTGEN